MQIREDWLGLALGQNLQPRHDVALAREMITERECQTGLSAFSLVCLTPRLDDHVLGELFLNGHPGHAGSVCK